MVPEETVVKALVILAVSIATYASRSLTLSGVLAAAFLGTIVLFLGDWGCFVLLLVFFILGVTFTKYRRSEKESGALVQEKNGIRSWVNVLANGGPAAISILLEYVFQMEVLPVFFLTAICSATADTMATEVGLLSKSKPRLITDLRRRVEKGFSGGVTLLGTVAGFFGSLAIALVSLTLYSTNTPSMLSRVTDVKRLTMACSIGGFLGMLIDSLLGATIQEVYVSKPNGRLYEKPSGGREYVLIKGFRGIDNNMVNFISGLLAGFSGIAIYRLLAF